MMQKQMTLLEKCGMLLLTRLGVCSATTISWSVYGWLGIHSKNGSATLGVCHTVNVCSQSNICLGLLLVGLLGSGLTGGSTAAISSISQWWQNSMYA